MRLAGIHRMCVLLLLFGAAVLVSCSDRGGSESLRQERSVLMSISTRIVDQEPTKADNVGELAINSLRVYAFYEGQPAGYYYQSSPVRDLSSFQ